MKVRVVKLRNAKSSVSHGHLAYLQREGAGVERAEGLDGSAELTPSRGQLYGPDEGVEIEGRDFVARSQESFDGRGDPHQFRIMISPEDGAELARVNGDGTPNLKDTTRALMAQIEEDLGTRLDWVAVDHFDTAHPHTHIIARGVTHDGKGLNIAGEYILRGIRGRLEEELTRELGWKDGQKAFIIYKRGYVKALELEGFNAATEKLEGMTGKAHVAAQTGQLIEGTVAQNMNSPTAPTQ